MLAVLCHPFVHDEGGGAGARGGSTPETTFGHQRLLIARGGGIGSNTNRATSHILSSCRDFSVGIKIPTHTLPRLQLNARADRRLRTCVYMIARAVVVVRARAPGGR